MPSVSSRKPTLFTHLTSLKSDVDASIRNIAKGSGAKAATLNELKKWLDSAVASPTDSLKTLRSGSPTRPTTQPVLSGKTLDRVLDSVNIRIARAAASNNPAKGGDVKRPSQKELKAWVTQALLEAAQGEVKVKLKSGGTRPATAAEITSWINKAN
ncbi:MAG: hypothetical protein JNG84_08425 [Archangium sp.]|nr:hypothetical protein [Archangium sp.]